MKHTMSIWSMVFMATTVLFCLHQAAVLTMVSEGQSLIMGLRQSVTLVCQFFCDDFNMFENPVIWKKTQKDEESPMNIMGNILEPFLSTNRFEVSFTSEPSRYQLSLSITDISLEDSGNYTCEIRGRRSIVVASVTHSIAVRTPIEHLFIETDNASTLLPINDRLRDVSLYADRSAAAAAAAGSLVFVEGVARKILCSAVGGFPLPEMSVHLGKRDLTRVFMLTNSVSLEGVRGLKQMRYKTERWTDQLVFGPSDDEQPIRCTVTVPGLPTTHRTINIIVVYRPVISCFDAIASVGDRNVALRCEVRARPPLSALFWLIDANGTTLTEGKVINEFWTFVMDRSDGVMETKLFMKSVSDLSFRRYTVIAENLLAANTAHVHLNQSVRERTPTNEASVLQTDLPPVGHADMHSRNHDDPAYVIISSSSPSSSLTFCLFDGRHCALTFALSTSLAVARLNMAAKRT